MAKMVPISFKNKIRLAEFQGSWVVSYLVGE